DEDDVLLVRIVRRVVDHATAAENGRDFLRRWIDGVHAAASAGRRDHRDLAILQPANLPRLVSPAAENVLRLAAAGVDHEQALVLEAPQLTDERNALRVRRPLEVRLVARV